MPPASERLFDDPALQDHYDRTGWAKVPVLPPDAATRLLGEVAAHYHDDRPNMTFANVDADRTFMRRVADVVAPYWAEHLVPLFPRHRVAFTTCVVKHPGPGSMMDAHEDGTFVDERHHRATTLWMSLVDCLPEDRNGMIRVLPGSHRMVPTAAGANVPEWHRDHKQFLTRHLEDVPTRAGEAVVWDTRVLHGSPANLSERSRFALAAVLVPRDAPLVHVEALSRRRRRAYAVDEAFHREHSPIAVRHVMPEYPVLAEFEEPVATVAPEAVARLCRSALVPDPERPDPGDEWFGRGRDSCDPPPSPLPEGVDPTVGNLDDLCAAAVIELREHLRSGRSGVELAARGSGGDRAAGFELTGHSGGWGAMAIVLDGRVHNDAAALLPCTARVAAEAGVLDAILFALTPGSRVELRSAATDPEVHLPLTLPSGEVGFATGSGSVRFTFGVPVAVPGAARVLVFNDGGEEVRWLLLRTGPVRRRQRWLAHVAGWLASRSAERPSSGGGGPDEPRL